mgnify:CR=1 FL=1
MSNLVDQLRKEAITDCVAYTEFMLQYRKGDDTLYCFFEGYEDRTYYSIRIKNISCANKYADYICGGKDEVLKVHSLIKSNSHYKSIKTGFFLDKDFDDITYSDDIYVTPTYSIENLYCNKEAFENILIAEFKMTKTDSDFVKCVESYMNLQQTFNQETLLLNSWLSCQADLRNQSGSKERLHIDKKTRALFDKLVLPDLSGIKNIPSIQTKEEIEKLFAEAKPIDKKTRALFDKLVLPDLSGIKNIPSIQTKEEIEKLFAEAKPIDNETLYKKVAKYNSIDQTATFRGKFLLRFLEAFLCKLQLFIGSANLTFKNRFSCSLRFETATICSGLSQYATTPGTLKTYINKVSS